MAQFIQFPTADGGTILVEVEEEQAADLVKAGLGNKVGERIVKLQDTFEATMMETVRRNAEAFIQTMRTISNPPAEAELAFGIKAIGEAGYTAVAKVGGDATYTVTLTWKRESESQEFEKE